MNLFLKDSFWSVFNYPTICSNITTFNGTSFIRVFGFGMIYSSHYVMDNTANKTFIFNENWSFVLSKTFIKPAYMIAVENSLYMTGDTNIWKLDEKLNTLIQYNATGNPSYRGLYFNSTNSWLYVTPYNLVVIHVFNLNLSLNHSFSTSSCRPNSITGYNNQLYIGTNKGTVLVVQNEVVLNEFNGCGRYNVTLTSILFDEYGYFATSCNNNKFYLLFANGTNTGKLMVTPTSTRYIGLDSKGHFIQISEKKITIYN